MDPQGWDGLLAAVTAVVVLVTIRGVAALVYLLNLL